MATLFSNIVLGVYGVISGSIEWKEGIPLIGAALAGLAVAIGCFGCCSGLAA
jgi:hypothetical protein